MGRQFTEIEPEHQGFIERQRLFFVATSAPGARINLSPKGVESLRVIGPRRVVWLNLTGSGNETAAHLLEDDRMTLMFCGFEGQALTLRLYGRARAIHRGEAGWEEGLALFPRLPGIRQVVELTVDLVQTSCGYGVPRYAYEGERKELPEWLEAKGDQGVERYWRERNRLSIDGRPTGIEQTARPRGQHQDSEDQ